ncbi:class I adenylate-forming enzyme family protein [Phytohabitans houttuyneae]|uniref:AMP-binding protein n=1 Tax=Phytohabitans houttuyneae TaxID=1076126 RepID=A0A6V8KKV4_9ACTN|nr:class I adenylate-forming enzyme family protein [Phytohabitans houttuyneae]GFJ82387.1 AMP-binding protein [Phytohabitans houttuyneae]
MAGSSGRSRVGPLSQWKATPAGETVEEPVGQVLARQVAAGPDRPALYWPEAGALASMTYAELGEAAHRLGRAMAGQARPGERVAVWSRNSVPYVLLEYASALAGLVFVPFNTAWTDAEAAHAVRLTRPALLFAGPSYAGDSLAPRAGALDGGTPVVDIEALEQWAATAAPGELPEVAPDQPFLIQFTSGTTGRSKGAVISHRAALNGALQRNRHDVIGDDDVWLNPVPYHHIGGSCFVILGGVLDGGAFVVMQRWDPAEVLRLLGLGVINRIGGVPTMLVDILAKLGDAARDAGLRSVALGGATVTQPLVDLVGKALGVPVLIGYGQSECPLITSTHIADDPATIGGTLGRPLPAADIRIADPESGAVLPVGTPGEILVRAPYMMSGYWDMPEQTAATITPDGYLRTGDLGEMDGSGFLTFRGRSRDVIIRGGENVYPAEVEEILLEHPGVAGAVLVGVEDARLGERVAGVVVRQPGSEVSGAELAAFLAGRVAKYKIPVAWRFVESFPMTASGKVRRFVVRDETNEELR